MGCARSRWARARKARSTSPSCRCPPTCRAETSSSRPGSTAPIRRGWSSRRSPLSRRTPPTSSRRSWRVRPPAWTTTATCCCWRCRRSRRRVPRPSPKPSRARPASREHAADALCRPDPPGARCPQASGERGADVLLARGRLPAGGDAVVGRVAPRAPRLRAAGAALLGGARAALHRAGHRLHPRPAHGRERLDAPRPARLRLRGRDLRRAGAARPHPHLQAPRADPAHAGHRARLEPGDADPEPPARSRLPGNRVLHPARRDRLPVRSGELDPLPARGAPPGRRGDAMIVGQALRDQQRELTVFRNRLMLAGLAIILAFAVLLGRFTWLQVVQRAYYHTLAEANRISVAPVVPNRGIILDRNGEVLAANYSAYTLEITPSKVASVESAIDELATIIDVSAMDRRRFKKLQEESTNFESLPIRTRLTEEEVARFAVNRFRFPGFEIKARLFRSYPQGEVASHAIGYIGRINDADVKRIDEQNLTAHYKGTDHIGKLGIEGAYEKELHGETGSEQVEIDAGGARARAPPSSEPRIA